MDNTILESDYVSMPNAISNSSILADKLIIDDLVFRPKKYITYEEVASKCHSLYDRARFTDRVFYDDIKYYRWIFGSNAIAVLSRDLWHSTEDKGHVRTFIGIDILDDVIAKDVDYIGLVRVITT